VDELSRQVERTTREAVLFASGLAMILVAISGTAVTKNPAFVALVVVSVLVIVVSKEVVNKNSRNGSSGVVDRTADPGRRAG
jgi:membrane protein implicated in regulation of membrane protease activity